MAKKRRSKKQIAATKRMLAARRASLTKSGKGKKATRAKPSKPKKGRSPAQRAATKRMLAARKTGSRGRSSKRSTDDDPPFIGPPGGPPGTPVFGDDPEPEPLNVPRYKPVLQKGKQRGHRTMPRPQPSFRREGTRTGEFF